MGRPADTCWSYERGMTSQAMLLLVQMLVNDPSMRQLQLLRHLKFRQWCYLSVHGFVMPHGQKTVAVFAFSD